MIKVCARCGVEFEVTTGGAKYCEDCRWFVLRDNARRWYAAHRELMNQRHKEWYAAHRELINQHRKEHYRRKKEPTDHD